MCGRGATVAGPPAHDECRLARQRRALVALEGCGDLFGGERGLIGDIEERAANVVLHADKVEVRLIRRADAVARRTSTLVEREQPVEIVERRAVAGGEDDDVVELLAPIGEGDRRWRKRLDAGADGDRAR